MVLWLDSDVQGSSQVPRGGKLEQEQKGLCRFPVRFPVRLGLRLYCLFALRKIFFFSILPIASKFA